MNVAEKADISKTTALKYLATLRAERRIDYIEVGPAKLWRLTPLEKAEKKHASTSRTQKIESALKEFKESVGLEGSAVVDNDGLTISADLPGDVEPEKMGGLISRLLQISTESASMARMDSLKGIIIEGEKGRIVARNGGNVLLIAFCGLDTPLGTIKLEIEDFADRINEILA